MDVWVAFEVGFAVCQMWLIRLHTHPYTPRALSHTCTQFHTDGDYRRINMSKCLAVITVSWQSWTWISAHTPTEELRESIVSHLLVHTSFVLLKWGNKNIFWFKCVFLLILNNPVTCNFIVKKLKTCLVEGFCPLFRTEDCLFNRSHAYNLWPLWGLWG